uniref:Uncharacterized protein n=1 Tax=Picea sitchensis TaxID=3332 RepID=A9NT52_PICSI|nr:unknown [Picea sitchensis]
MEMEAQALQVHTMSFQVILALVALGLMWALQGLPRSLISKLRRRSRSREQSRRHFVRGAQLLGRSRAASAQNSGRSLAREAAAEADKAIALDPMDAASHILKALALERQGHATAAIGCLDAALAPPVSKSLSAPEKSDGLLKRAELELETSNSKRRGLEAAVDDLKASVGFNARNFKALCLLGTCYEKKGMLVEARKVFQDALEANPSSQEAKAGLDRLS